jgi:hypothetical protein
MPARALKGPRAEVKPVVTEAFVLTPFLTPALSFRPHML